MNDFNEKVITKILKSYDLELLENKEEVINRIHEAEKYIPLD